MAATASVMPSSVSVQPPRTLGQYASCCGVSESALNLIFSFTNGTDWDGPYRLQFQVPKAWRNSPPSFFNEGLANELSKEGACERAIFPDTNIVITRCAMGDRCNLDFVVGCSHLFNEVTIINVSELTSLQSAGQC